MTGRCFLALAALAMAVATARAGSPYYVSDRSGGEIYRIRDLNADGDALDAGEKVLWADGMVEAIDLTTDGRAIFAVDRAANLIMRYADTNGDGDALDVGEATVWADGLGNPYGITMAAGGAVYYTEYSAGEVRRLRDLNGDGDALDAGERVTYARSVGSAISVMVRPDDLVVSSYVGDKIYRVRDLNGDGDALDVGETLDFTPPLLNSAHGLLLDAAGGFFAGARDADTVYRVWDRNGDGDAFDVIEVLSYADNVFGRLDGPWGMAGYPGGGFLVAEYVGDKVSLVRDLNGDGDALDIGEAVRFADGVDAVGIVSMPDPGAVGYNNVEIVSGAGNWNISHTNVFQSYGDGAELGVERIVGEMTGGVSLRVITGSGGFNSGQGDLTLGTPLDFHSTGLNALTLTAAGTIVVNQAILDSTAGGDSLDLVLTADAEGDGTGDVSVSALIDLGTGTFTSEGTDFDNTGGPISAGQTIINHAGNATVGALMSAVDHSITAHDVIVSISGELCVNGGTLQVSTPDMWSVNGTLNLVETPGHTPLVEGTPVVIRGLIRASGETRVESDTEFQGTPMVDTPTLSDTLLLEGVFGIGEATTLTKDGAGVLTMNGPQSHGPGSFLDILGGTVFLNSNAGNAGAANLSILVGDAVLNFGCNQYLDMLTLQNGALVRFTGADVVVLKHLVMNGLDLGAMTLTPEPATLTLLAAGLAALIVRKRRS